MHLFARAKSRDTRINATLCNAARVSPPPPPSRRAKMTRNPLSAWKGLNVVVVVVSPINFNRGEENISPGKVHSRASPRGDRRSKRGWLRQVSLTGVARLERLRVYGVYTITEILFDLCAVIGKFIVESKCRRWSSPTRNSCLILILIIKLVRSKINIRMGEGIKSVWLRCLMSISEERGNLI